MNIQREKEELEQREAELQKVRKAEEERLRQEAKEREKERILQEHEQIKKKTVRERLEQIKKTELGAKAFKDIDIEVHNLLFAVLSYFLKCFCCYIARLPEYNVFSYFYTVTGLEQSFKSETLCHLNIYLLTSVSKS